MTKFLSGCAAAALLGAFALATPAAASEKKADGLRNASPSVTDWSAKRKKKRVVIREYYDDEPRYSYRTHRTYRSWDHDGPYRGYGYHRGPGVSGGVGGVGVGIGVDRW